MAGVARLHPDVRQLFGDVDGELVHTLFAAGRADDPPEGPFRGTERTDQRALAAVPQGAQDTGLRPAGAERAERRRVLEIRPFGPIGERLGGGLQERPGEQRLGGREVGVLRTPEPIEHLPLVLLSGGREPRGRLREGKRRDLLDQGEKGQERGEESREIEPVAQRPRQARRLSRAVPGGEAGVERFLEAGDALVEAQGLGGEGVRSGELRGALDPPLPLPGRRPRLVPPGLAHTTHDGTSPPTGATRRRAAWSARPRARPRCPCRRG